MCAKGTEATRGGATSKERLVPILGTRHCWRIGEDQKKDGDYRRKGLSPNPATSDARMQNLCLFFEAKESASPKIISLDSTNDTHIPMHVLKTMKVD